MKGSSKSGKLAYGGPFAFATSPAINDYLAKHIKLYFNVYQLLRLLWWMIAQQLIRLIYCQKLWS